MELLSTGIPILDDALGGGLLEDSNILIVYDSYSNGWTLAFEILRNRIMEGDFGVILDSVLPFTPLKMELGLIRFDIEEFGKKNNLAIVDLFSSIYGVDYPLDFVYTNKSIDTSTFVPKYNYLYRRILEEKIKDRRPIGIDFTIDGLAFLFGEDNFIKLFQNLIALKEKARITEKRKRPINIFLLNKGRASERLTAWIALYSQYVIEFCSSSKTFREKMVIRKSPLPDFKPKEGGYDFWIGEGQVHIE
ncbi:hypothetical protein, conserved [Thermococcus kodakarensis KOD1]|uniref:KaiC-like domain-containing protein n=1 Tax=Thermococcus kodakarensis (strain ATCC BAA-918 / JCM 12380 / KOD1) TaxID=69014 RepID=Q5JDV5_THEKO|nr:hypothetical protein [Thermococcus kodakarensis]WCN29396.1 hypothetical protein POG15_09295 [Thermococcus kodakarensis]WCN31684.1 hypothetical protein POG21_09280 [Thermococcus kodakarensis]BAD86013.1 hypothetical protein, conserved [Thermococcus kodakarensis KOD1]